MDMITLRAVGDEGFAVTCIKPFEAAKKGDQYVAVLCMRTHRIALETIEGVLVSLIKPDDFFDCFIDTTELEDLGEF